MKKMVDLSGDTLDKLLERQGTEIHAHASIVSTHLASNLYDIKF
jgi:hypothetical protein